MQCVQELPELPFTSVSLCGPGTYERSRTKKLQALTNYLKVLDQIGPVDSDMTRPTLWHDDLHAQNIFVDPKDPTTITGIIDWQSTEIAPLFVQARQPAFLDYREPQTAGVERPELPNDVRQLPADQQQEVRALYVLQSLSAGYRKWLQVHFPEALSALEFQETSSADLLLLAKTLLVDGEAMYMGRLLEMSKDEPVLLPGLAFTDQEEADVLADVEASSRAMDLMAGIRNTLGDLFPRRGILVKPTQYDQVKDALGQMKEQVIEQYATSEEERETWKKGWQWDD